MVVNLGEEPQPDPTTTTSVETDLSTVTPLISLEVDTTTLATGVEDRILGVEDPETNEVNIDLEQFISEETAAAAKKFGYKILFKKIGGKEVPVGKIKFSFPTIVEVEEEEK